jgi:centromere-localized protein 2
MPPTESQILSHFLLPPAPLPAVISLSKFTDLFPADVRSNPQIPVLYRELQHQRAIDVDDVKSNISNEVKKGDRQRKEIARARRRKEDEEDAHDNDGIEMAMEVQVGNIEMQSNV